MDSSVLNDQIRPARRPLSTAAVLFVRIIIWLLNFGPDSVLPTVRAYNTYNIGKSKNRGVDLAQQPSWILFRCDRIENEPLQSVSILILFRLRNVRVYNNYMRAAGDWRRTSRYSQRRVSAIRVKPSRILLWQLPRDNASIIRRGLGLLRNTRILYPRHRRLSSLRTTRATYIIYTILYSSRLNTLYIVSVRIWIIDNIPFTRFIAVRTQYPADVTLVRVFIK